MSAPSMAAALAASLPMAAPAQNTSTSAPGQAKTQQAKDAIPASLKDSMDVEATLPINSVSLDALVLLKIVKHSQDSLNAEAQGHLIGLDLNNILEISDSFPLPALPSSERGADEERERANGRATHSAYSQEMLKALSQISAADSVVGTYFSSPNGAFMKMSLVEAQAAYQAIGGRKGVVVVHDPTKTANVSLRAFRFSAGFAEAYKANKFDTQALVENRITFSTILTELPIQIRTSPLITAYLATLSLPPANTSTFSASTSTDPTFAPSYSPLSLDVPNSLIPLLESTSRSLDEFRRESDSLSYNARDIARQKVKLESLLQSRRDENTVRAAQGLALLPEDEVRRMVKVPQEASRLNGLLLLGQIEEFAKGMGSEGRRGLSGVYARA